MARKRNKREGRNVFPTSEPVTRPPAEGPPLDTPDPSLEPAEGPPAPEVELMLIPTAAHVPAPAPEPEPAPAPPPAPPPEPAPAVAFPPTPAPPPASDPVPVAALAPAAPTALVPVAQPYLAPLEERISRLEQTVEQLGNLQGLEQRLTNQIHRETTSPISPVLTAAALVDAGRQLLPALSRPSGPATTVPSGGAGPGRIPTQGSSWAWMLRDVVSEVQAIYYMYVDPRYRLSWVGRVVPPVLLVLFLFSSYWIKYSFCGLGGLPFLEKPIELMLCYVLFRVVAVEARRYRDSAPDIPAHLRS